jgi:Tfp pilus assembly protein PilF
MIRRLFTGIVFLATALAGMAQGQVSSPSLIRARYLLSEKMYDEAYTTLNNQQFSGSEQNWSALIRGKALSGLNMYEEANSWLQQVSGDGMAEATYCMAKNYLFLNDVPNAIGYLGKHLADKNHYPEKYIQLDSDFSKIENTRDWVHLWQRDWYSESEQQVAEGVYLISQGQVEEAGTLAENLLSAHSVEPQAWLLKARVHLIQKEDRMYREALDRAWQLAADNLTLKNELIRFALESGNFDKVNEMAADLLRRDPSNPEYIIDRALVRILEGKESLAVKEIETVEENGITPSELYYQAGRKILTSSPGQAESYLTKAIDNGILDARFYFARGLARKDLEKTDLALDDLAMSLDINPIQPELYLIRAKIRLDIGDADGACHDWRKALEMGNGKAADLLYKYCRLP